MTRVLVCGGRDFDDADMLNRTMDELHAATPFTCVIDGGAWGADRLAYFWACNRGLLVERYRADWRAHGKRAGPIRNQQMLDEGKPAVVVAFPGGHGTSDMVRRAMKAGLKIVEVQPARPQASRSSRQGGGA